MSLKNGNHEYNQEIEYQLIKWRMELTSAAGILKGDYLEQLKKMIVEMTIVLGIDPNLYKVSDTGTFEKIDL